MDSNQKHRLERERARLVQELARINKLLRSDRARAEDSGTWDFDPRLVSEAA